MPTADLTLEDFRYSVGNGNWEYFERSGVTLADIYASAAEWKAALAGVERPWLCWNVDSDWSVVQQRLVKSVGWTPVVGFDPRVGPPSLEPGAILIDFNKTLKLPTMWMHFPMEFIHLFAPRLAFWHADLLVRPEKMRVLARLFADLPDGHSAVVKPQGGWHWLLNPKQRRYWELVGCTTRAASEDAFAKGASWWMSFAAHPSISADERRKRAGYYWDCGTGIHYWHKNLGGKVETVSEKYVAEGHFTGIGNKDYTRNSPKNHKRELGKELSANFALQACCAKLGLEGFLE